MGIGGNTLKKISRSRDLSNGARNGTITKPVAQSSATVLQPAATLINFSRSRGRCFYSTVSSIECREKVIHCLTSVPLLPDLLNFSPDYNYSWYLLQDPQSCLQKLWQCPTRTKSFSQQSGLDYKLDSASIQPKIYIYTNSYHIPLSLKKIIFFLCKKSNNFCSTFFWPLVY